jgi:hypothetical protein
MDIMVGAVAAISALVTPCLDGLAFVMQQLLNFGKATVVVSLPRLVSVSVDVDSYVILYYCLPRILSCHV